MKITLNHSKLTKALQYASRAVNQKPNIPILSNVLLEVSKTDMKISATNLDIGINMWIPGVTDLQGSTTVSAKYIADFVSASSSDKVEIELKDTILAVNAGKAKANFTIIPSTEFPKLPELNGDPLFVINRKELLKTIDKILFACSTDLSAGKIQQSGVLFELKDDTLTFIGLDGFRLSKRETKLTNVSDTKFEGEIIVPARYLNEVAKILTDYEEVEDVKVYINENKSQIIFKIEEIEISIRLIEGPFPEYKKILPTGFSYSFEVYKNDLEEALRVVNTFAKSNLSSKTLLDFDVTKSTVKLKTNLAEVGENETMFDVYNPVGTADLFVAYNLKFIIDVTSHIEGEVVSFETNGPLAPTVIRDKSDTNFTHLLMPLRRE